MNLNLSGVIRRNAPTILACFAAIGTVTTAIFAAKAAPEAKERLIEAEEEKQEPLTLVEKAVVVAPVYWPAVVTGTATVASIIGGGILSNRRQASLISAYTMLGTGFKEYKKQVIGEYGEEADYRIEKRIAEGKMADSFTDEKFIFRCDYFDDDIVRTKEDVFNAFYHTNRNFALRGYSPLRELKEFLGVETRDLDTELGWSMYVGPEYYGYSWIDYYLEEVTDPDGIKVLEIRFPFDPTTDYLDEYSNLPYNDDRDHAIDWFMTAKRKQDRLDMEAELESAN